jgi:hypothetical protein
MDLQIRELDGLVAFRGAPSGLYAHVLGALRWPPRA